MQVKRNPWTPTQLKAFRKLYPHKRTADIVDVIGHSVDTMHKKAMSLGITKSAAFMKSKASGNFVKGAKNSNRSTFKKCDIPWNKGMKGLQIRGVESRFKKGNTPKNYKPIGTVVTHGDGYCYTKIADPNVWELTHRLTWRLAGNEPPVHPNVLRFKDGNQLNCTIENLELSSKVGMMAANSVQRLPEDLRRAIHLHGVLIRAINGN